MTGHQLDALGGKLVGDRHRLLRVAGIVADIQHELLAQHPAGLVQIGDRLLGAFLHLRAERRIFPGDRPGDGDMDRLRPAGHRRAGQQDGNGRRGAQKAELAARLDGLFQH